MSNPRGILEELMLFTSGWLFALLPQVLQECPAVFLLFLTTLGTGLNSLLIQSPFIIYFFLNIFIAF